jgi:opacity protein-like surface antigen
MALAVTQCLCLCLIGPAATARAQTAAGPGPGVATKVEAETPAPAWDVTGLLGWRGVRMIWNRPYDPVDYDNRLLAGVLVGRHWTPHVKTEVEIGTTRTSDALTFTQPDYDLPGYPTRPYIYSTHRVRDTVFSAAALYQFGVDAWFHPHVGAGVEVARTRDDATTTRQTLSVGTPPRQIVIAEPSSTSTRTVTARAFLTTGFKAYASERVFVRTDLRVAAGQTPANVSARFGVGFDF